MADYTRIGSVSGSDEAAYATTDSIRQSIEDRSDARTIAGANQEPADDTEADRWRLRVGQIVLHVERRLYYGTNERFSIRCDDPLMTSTHFSETAPTYQKALEIARKLGKALNRVAQLQMIATEALNEAVETARADLRACWGIPEAF